MSFSPFDGVILDDARPPIPGAKAVLLHLQVERKLARRQERTPLGLEGVRDRAAACRELLAHGLFPDTLRGLGLPMGSPRTLRSLGNLADHLEAYLQAVAATGHLEPDEALWSAVTSETDGRRGVWIERTGEDGPVLAGIQELQPTRLRALACLEGLGAIHFRLATRKGDGSSGLFGGSLGLADWFLEGLERFDPSFSNGFHLDHPAGWAEHAPWASALEGLFEGPLRLDSASQAVLQRALVESPLDLLRHAVELVAGWVAEGMAPADITLVHPAPADLATLLEPLLAGEGLSLQVRGGVRPLLLSPAWAPLWALVEGLQQADPCRAAAGLRASARPELAAWSEELARADQTGLQGFTDALAPLPEPQWTRAAATWAELQEFRSLRTSAWADRLGRLAYALRLPVESEAFFGPLNLLHEAWGRETWTFAEMQEALQAFLETATDPEVSRDIEGVRLVSPEALLTDWKGCRAAVVMDLSEGAWPAPPRPNPDLNWDRKAALNAALLKRTAEAPAAFPPALQRFRLPRCEHGETLPRAFQRDAYAFNTLLALTRERVVALSPAQDAEGNPLGQGPFWNALEGAGEWVPDADRAASRLRLHWEGPIPDPLSIARAEATQARTLEEALAISAPLEDQVPGIRSAWLKDRAASATPLEALARCPFRSLAERVWGLSSFDARGRFVMARGSLVHALLQETLRPFVGATHWPDAFREEVGLEYADILARLQALWAARREGWLETLAREVPSEQHPLLGAEVVELIPNLARYLEGDLVASGPTKLEVCLLHPGLAPIAEWQDSRKAMPIFQDGWTRGLLDLETELGPVDLDLGEGVVLPLAGKADRIDRWTHPEAGTFLRVIDYKTSRSGSLRAYAEGDAPFSTHLQPPLYALLAELRHDAPATAVLVPLREDAPRPWDWQLAVLARSEAAGRPWRERLKATLLGLSRRLDRGDFPATPGEHCTYCQLPALCGRPVDIQAEPDDGDPA